MKKAITKLQLGNLVKHSSGKVREIFDLGDEFLFVASDRLSAFDVIMPQGIPDKGVVLTQMSLFWFDLVSDVVDNHLVTADFKDFPEHIQQFSDQLAGRSMIVKKAEVFPVECIVRGYIVGSGWSEYLEKGSVSGIELPPGLKLCDKLDKPIFTPSTKATSGHDENISYGQMVDIIGDKWASALRDSSMAIYERARDYAAKKGIIIADTKFEFGLINDRLTLVDEVLTPDSSRFWPADSYKAGKNQPSFDKQFVRDWLETLDWDKTPPGPDFPDEIVLRTREKYLEAYRLLTGKNLNN